MPIDKKYGFVEDLTIPFGKEFPWGMETILDVGTENLLCISIRMALLGQIIKSYCKIALAILFL